MGKLIDKQIWKQINGWKWCDWHEWIIMDCEASEIPEKFLLKLFNCVKKCGDCLCKDLKKCEKSNCFKKCNERGHYLDKMC